MLVFNTDSIPRHERADAMWSAMMDTAFSTTLLHEEPASDVYMQMRQWQLGPVELASVQCSGVRLIRTPKQTAQDGGPVVAIGLHTTGNGMQSQDENPVGVGAGRLFALEMTKPYDHHQFGPASSRVVKIPAAQLGLPLDLVAKARVQLASSPVRNLFAQHFHTLVDQADQLRTDSSAAMVGAATVELARALIASAGHDGRYSRDALADTLLLQVKSYVRDHLHDPKLGAPEIAAAHHISVRHLYKLCALEDIRLEQWIINERLERARRELAHPNSRQHTIAATAQRWGFTNASHFTHRFHEAYGMSPRDWRHLSSQAPDVRLHFQPRDGQPQQTRWP